MKRPAMPIIKSLRMLLLLSAGAAVAFSAGCYTQIRTPEASFDRGPSSSTWYEDSWYGRWTDPYYTAPDFYASYYPYFYAPPPPSAWPAPWWYWDYWYRAPLPPPSLVAPPVVGGRTGWDRGPGAPPDVPAVPGGRIGSAPGAGSAPARDTEASPPPDTTRTRSTRGDREREEPRRGAWGR